MMAAFTLASALAYALAPALACTAAGAVIGRGASRMPGADMLVGVGLAGGVLTILAVTTHVPLSMLMLGIGALALLAPLLRRTMPGGVTTWVALALAAPLLVHAASTQAALWDEFWQWLPNAAYAFTHDALARRELPPSTAHFPGYPQTIPLAMAAASFLARRFLESAGAVTNVALLTAYAALLADTMIVLRRRNNMPVSPFAAIAITAIAAAAVLVIDPGLDGEVLLSSYGDPGTMVMVGALGLLGIELLARLSGRSAAAPAEIAWRFGFVAAALINLKQANPILLVLIMAGLSVIVLCDRDIRLRRALGLLPHILGPAIVLYLAWRWYLFENLPSGEVHIRPLGSWNFSAMGATIAAMLRVAAEKPLFHGGMWLITAFGFAVLPGLRRQGSEVRWLAVITAIVWVGYNVFLLAVYLAVFSEDEARWAGDYWRYTPHVALLGLGVPLVALAQLRLAKPTPVAATAAVTAIAAVGAVLSLGAPLLRTDLGTPAARRWPLLVRSIDAELNTMLPPGAGVIVALAFNLDPFPVIVHYDLWELGDPARTKPTTTIWYGEDLGLADKLVARGEAQYLILQDRRAWAIDKVAARLGVTPPQHELVLFTWRDGKWQKMKSWPIPTEP